MSCADERGEPTDGPVLNRQTDSTCGSSAIPVANGEPAPERQSADARALTKIVAFGGNIIERTAERTVPWPDGNKLLAPGELAKLLDEQFRHPDATVGY